MNAVVTRSDLGGAIVHVGELVTFGGVNVHQLLEQIGETHNVALRINSSGGNSVSAIKLYDALVGRMNITADITGQCCSAAVIVAMSARRIRIASDARMLVHRPIDFVAGDYNFLRQRADGLETLTERFAGIVQKRTGASAETVEQWFSRDTWFDATVAVQSGLADEVYTPKAARVSAAETAAVIGRPSQSGEEKLFFELLRGFDRLPVSDVQNFRRELAAWCVYNIVPPGVNAVGTELPPPSLTNL